MSNLIFNRFLRPLHFGAILSLASVFLLAAPGSSETIYRRILPNLPLSLDPSELSDVHSIQVMVQVAEGLTTFEGETLRPAVAQRWEMSEDLKEYRFYLDPEAKFSDGSPITAQEVIRSLENVMRPQSSVWKELDVIEGAEAFHDKGQKNVSGLQAVSRSVVKIKLVKAFPPFLSLLASPNFSILPQSAIANLRRNTIQPFVGSGPYELVSVVNQNQLGLKKNRFYRNAKDVYFDSILYDIVPNKELAVQGFLSGKYQDIWPYHVPTLPANLISKVTEIPTVTAFTWYLRLNAKNKILSHLGFRQWLSQQLNPEGFLTNLNLPGIYLSHGYIPRGFLGYREANPKIEKRPSREVLEAAGCSLEQPCKLDLIFSHDIENALQRLLQPLERYRPRLQIHLKKLPRGDWYAQSAAHNYDLVFTGNSFEQRESYFCLRDLLAQFAGEDIPAPAKKNINLRLEAALKVNDLNLRGERYAEIEESILAHALIIPIYQGDIPYRQVRREVTGYSPSILGYPYLKLSKLRAIDHHPLSE